MDTKVRDYLIELARKKETCYYQQISDDLGMGLDVQNDQSNRNKMSGILEDIADYEITQFRPMLTIIVLNKIEKFPGQGAFRIAKKFDLLKDTAGEPDKLQFYESEKQKVFDYWSKN